MRRELVSSASRCRTMRTQDVTKRPGGTVACAHGRTCACLPERVTTGRALVCGSGGQRFRVRVISARVASLPEPMRCTAAVEPCRTAAATMRNACDRMRIGVARISRCRGRHHATPARAQRAGESPIDRETIAHRLRRRTGVRDSPTHLPAHAHQARHVHTQRCSARRRVILCVLRVPLPRTVLRALRDGARCAAAASRWRPVSRGATGGRGRGSCSGWEGCGTRSTPIFHYTANSFPPLHLHVL